MATNMQNKLEYSNLLYCNTIDYNQKVLCNAREVEFKRGERLLTELRL